MSSKNSKNRDSQSARLATPTRPRTRGGLRPAAESPAIVDGDEAQLSPFESAPVIPVRRPVQNRAPVIDARDREAALKLISKLCRTLQTMGLFPEFNDDLSRMIRRLENPSLGRVSTSDGSWSPSMS